MNITFDKSLKQQFWQIVNKKIDNHDCPFCGRQITGKNFVGAAWIDGEFRAFDRSITCLIELSKHIKDEE